MNQWMRTLPGGGVSLQASCQCFPNVEYLTSNVLHGSADASSQAVEAVVYSPVTTETDTKTQDSL